MYFYTDSQSNAGTAILSTKDVDNLQNTGEGGGWIPLEEFRIAKTENYFLLLLLWRNNNSWGWESISSFHG